jgi:hypothetical protein
LTEVRWLALTTAGGATAVAALAGIAWCTSALRRRARRVAGGDFRDAFQMALDDPPLSVLIATILVCQGCAHLALLAAGVPAQLGPVASPLVHVAAALAGALLLHGALRFADRAAEELAQAIAQAVARMGASDGWSSIPAVSVAACTQNGEIHGRAPPP